MKFAQLIAKNFGESGCYCVALARCALIIAGVPLPTPIGFLALVLRACELGGVSDEFYVQDAHTFVNNILILSGSKKRLHRIDVNVGTSDVHILRYVNGAFTHFVVSDRGVIFDPLGDSNTVKNGTLSERRYLVIS
jgi:hypothetical protein